MSLKTGKICFLLSHMGDLLTTLPNATRRFYRPGRCCGVSEPLPCDSRYLRGTQAVVQGQGNSLAMHIALAAASSGMWFTITPVEGKIFSFPSF